MPIDFHRQYLLKSYKRKHVPFSYPVLSVRAGREFQVAAAGCLTSSCVDGNFIFPSLIIQIEPGITPRRRHTFCMMMRGSVWATLSQPVSRQARAVGGSTGGPRMESGSQVLVPPVPLGCSPHSCVLSFPELGTRMGRASGLGALLAPMRDDLGGFVPHLDGALGAALTPHLSLFPCLSAYS